MQIISTMWSLLKCAPLFEGPICDPLLQMVLEGNLPDSHWTYDVEEKTRRTQATGRLTVCQRVWEKYRARLSTDVGSDQKKKIYLNIVTPNTAIFPGPSIFLPAGVGLSLHADVGLVSGSKVTGNDKCNQERSADSALPCLSCSSRHLLTYSWPRKTGLPFKDD